MAAAAAAGHGLPALLTALQLLGLSLSCDQTAQLARWHDKGRQLQLLTLAVLRTESRALMQQIHQTPALRSVLGELLSPTQTSVTAPAADRALPYYCGILVRFRVALRKPPARAWLRASIQS